MYSGKFRPKPIETEHGHFDSTSEYQRYLLLLDMERNGEISDLKRQVTFELLPQQTKVVKMQLKTKTKDIIKVIEQDMNYTCDFTYYKEGEYIVEDHKGSRWNVDEAMRIKKKLLYYFHGIELKFSFPPPREKKKKRAK